METPGLPTGMQRAASLESKCADLTGGIFQRAVVPPRVVVCEAAIDALSLAASRAHGPCTATAGGTGPATMAALHHILAAQAGERAAMIVAATDADVAGRHHAARLKEFAVKARVRSAEILPPDGLNDWNDAIRSVSLRQ